MKKLVFMVALLASTSSLAITEFVKGTYLGKDGCQLTISTEDFFRTGVTQLVAEMGETKITPWGAILTQSLKSAKKQLVREGYIELDNAAGMGSYIMARLKFNNDLTIDSFIAQEFSPRGGALGELYSCDNMILKKEETK